MSAHSFNQLSVFAVGVRRRVGAVNEPDIFCGGLAVRLNIYLSPGGIRKHEAVRKDRKSGLNIQPKSRYLSDTL